MGEERPTVPWKKFYVHLSGKTNGAHLPWVSKFKGIGQVKVDSPENSDYILLFCPIASRVGTDISEALENIPAGDKPIILVVMHHTFNKDHVVAESRRQVSDPKVLLVVDTLFYEGHPLQSNRNKITLDEIKKFLGVRTEVSRFDRITNCEMNNKRTVMIVAIFVVLAIWVIIMIYLFCKSCVW